MKHDPWHDPRCDPLNEPWDSVTPRLLSREGDLGKDQIIPNLENGVFSVLL